MILDPQSGQKPKHNDRMALWMLVVVVIITAAVSFWSRSKYQQENSTERTHVDEQGQCMCWA